MEFPPEFYSDLHIYNNSEMARRYEVHRATVAKIRKERGVPNPETNKVIRPKFNLPELEDVDPEDLWNTAEELRRKILADNTRQEEVTVELSDNSPVLLVWLSDWHIGHMETDMDKLKEDLLLIRDTPGVYVAFGGDYTENTNTAKASRGTHNEQLLPIRIQKKLVKYACELVHEKTLVLLKGNHDAWSESSDDFDFVEYLSQELEIPYLGEWGILNTVLNDQTYRILMAHKGRGGGKDKSAPAKNLMDLIGDVDGVFTGHKHDSSIAEAIVRGKPVAFGTAGSYLESGRFGRGLSLPKTVPDMPGFVLFDRHKQLFPVRDSLQNLWVLEGAKQRYDI